MNFIKSCCLILITFFSLSTFAAGEKVTATESIPGLDDMRCERVSSITLAEFKTKLVENCNLNKPFSSSVSRLIDVDTYLYCCHKR